MPTALEGSVTLASFTNLECAEGGGTTESGYVERNRFALEVGSGSMADECGGVRRLDVPAEVRLGYEDEVDAEETDANIRVCLGDALMGVLEGGSSDGSRRGREYERERGATWMHGGARLEEGDRLEDEAT